MSSMIPRHLIVAAWNKSEVTQRFLESFSRCSAHPWRLIVVDNGSTDATSDLLKTFADHFPALTVLKNEVNLGCARAWNRGIQMALQENSELIGVLNNDLVFAPGWDAGLLKFHRDHPEQKIFSPHTLRCELEDFELRAIKFMKRNAQRTRRHFGSEGMFFDPEVFAQVGLFDERFFVSYEDTDFYVRARKLRMEPTVTGASVLWHREKTTRGEMGSAHEIESREKFIQKWGDLEEALEDSPWRKSRWVIRYRRYREKLGLL